MPDQNGNVQSEEKKNFIRETVEPRRKNRKRNLMIRLIILICSGIVLGVIACFSFLLARPWAESILGVTQETAESVVIPRDEPESETAEAETSSDPEELEAEIESMVQSRVDAYLSTMDMQIEAEVTDDRDRLTAVQELLEPSLVRVTSRSAGEDVFKNSFTRSEQTFGIVLARTEEELLILTESTLAADGGVFVTVMGETVDAQLRAADQSLNMAVVEVKKDALVPETWEAVKPAVLGNSYSIHQGDFVAALGNPMGSTGSVLAGDISYIKELQQGTDFNFQLVQTDMACDQEATGILVNEDGAVVGWISQKYNSGSMAGMLSAISISEVKGMIEKLSNGKAYACAGIQFLTVDAETSEAQEIPVGLYITKCVKGGAAYEAGIQNGDVLTKIGEDEITRDIEFRRIMEEKKPGDVIAVTVMRQGRGGYAEETYELTLTAR